MRANIASLVLAGFLLIGCQASEEPSASQAIPAQDGASTLDARAKKLAPLAHRPMIAHHAAVGMRVADVAEALSAVGQRATARGGFLEESFLNRLSEDPNGRAVARIPEKELDAFLADLDGLGTIERKHLSSEDVGEEAVELDRRIANWRAEEVRLVELFRKAGRVSDLLEVERELARVRGEIETALGRSQYLQRKVALSTVEIDLYGRVSPSIPIGWSLGTELKEALAALMSFGLGLASLMVWIMVFAPVWVPLGLAARWSWRRRKRA